MTDFPVLLSPIEVGHTTLRNRVMMGSIHTGLEDRAKDVDKLAAYFAERARGQVGLIVTGGYAPNKRGWLKPFSSEMTNRLQAMRHTRVTDAVHAEGGAIAMQVEAALPAAEAGRIVTFGITPDRPETGYGYLELAGAGEGPQPLARFVEKPDADRAGQMLAAGNYLWNAGIFLFSARTMIEAFRAHAPAYLEPVQQALDQAPATEDGRFRVPQILGTEG